MSLRWFECNDKKPLDTPRPHSCYHATRAVAYILPLRHFCCYLTRSVTPLSLLRHSCRYLILPCCLLLALHQKSPNIGEKLARPAAIVSLFPEFFGRKFCTSIAETCQNLITQIRSPTRIENQQGLDV